MNESPSNMPLILLWSVAAFFLAWSSFNPLGGYDVWAFENLPGVIGLTLLTATYKRFQFSSMIYWLVGIHFVILAIGAKYTYAEMPLFNWLKESLDLSRNHYDRVGHFAQGFFPAMVAREILVRTTALRPGKMLFFLCVCICLAFSALWEMIEWWVVIGFYASEGKEWIGEQGDVWDAQKDMLMATLGAMLSQVLLSRRHDRAIKTNTKPGSDSE